jgi:hypothetical protein
MALHSAGNIMRYQIGPVWRRDQPQARARRAPGRPGAGAAARCWEPQTLRACVAHGRPDREDWADGCTLP